MKTFFKQQNAFDALKVGQCMFQNQTGGKRYYVACTNEEYWKTYLEKGDRFGYELIMKGIELQQMCNALIHKVKTLEYMLQMFQRNETIASNKLLQAY